MKIVLVRPNYKSHIITPPLGLGYLASSLKKAKIKAVIIDGLKENLKIENLIAKIKKLKPDAVGITCLTAFYEEVVVLAKALKKENYKVIIGGVHPTFLPYQTLVDSSADYVVCGEGEIAFTKLVKSNFINRNITGVYSLKNLKKNDIVKKAEIVKNLDDLSFPDWKQLDPNSYPKAPHGAFVRNFPIGIIMTTRGCPYKCSFCASRRFYDLVVRFRSPENVIKEIKYLVKNFGIKEIHFEDDNLTLRRKHIETICKLILKNNLKITWACPNGVRADKVDENLLRLMKKSGCYLIAFGIESANPNILKNINKLETIDTIKKSIDLAYRVRIECQGFFILGLPGETKETMEESICFAKKSKLTRASFAILDVLPGSELWDKLEGQFQPNWEKSSYREPEWVPNTLTKKQLMDVQTRALREFYFRPFILFNIIKSIKLKQIKFLVQRIVDYGLYRRYTW